MANWGWMASVSGLALALASASGGAPAGADDAANADSVEVITVKGQKIERSLQDTKESIAVVTETDFDNFVLLELEDVFTATANTYAFNGGESFGIRGVSQNSASTGGGSGELASLYLDGVAYTGFSSRFGPKDLWDVAQVEVLRGPQSTNVGRNALAGAVKIITNRPSLEGFDAAVRAQAGSYGTYSAEGMVNFTLGDTSALRFTAEYFESEGFVENITRDEDDYDARENVTLRGKYLFEPNDRFSVLANISYAETERGQDIYRSDLEPEGSRRSSANLAALETYEALSASVDAAYVLNDRWSVRSITSYLDGEYDRFDDDDEGPEGGERFRARQADEGNWGQELRLNYTGERLDGVVGAFYTELTLSSQTPSLIGIAPANVGVPASLLAFYPEEFEITSISSTDLDTTNIAFFTEWDWQVTDRLTLSAGLRYDEEEQDNAGATSNTVSDDTPLPDPQAVGDAFGPAAQAGVEQVNGILLAQLQTVENGPETATYDAFLPQLGVTYDVTGSVSVSAFYKRGYRAGGVEFNAVGQRDPYDPEYLDNFEIALRSTGLDGRLVLNANVYYGLWTDQQVRVPIDGSTVNTDIQNAGESTISGLELEARLAATDRTSLFASLGYAQTEFDEFCQTGGEPIDRLPNCEVNGVVGEDLSGNNFAFSPELTLAFGGRHNVTDALYVSGSVTHQDASLSDVENTPEFETDAFTLVNLRAGYERDDVELAIYGTNIFDETYAVFNGSGLATGTRLTRTGAPAEFGVLVSKRF